MRRVEKISSAVQKHVHEPKGILLRNIASETVGAQNDLPGTKLRAFYFRILHTASERSGAVLGQLRKMVI